MSLVRQDIAVFKSRKRDGDIGADDDARERKLIAFIKDYLTKPVPASYKIPEGLPANSIVPRAYLQIRARTLPVFANHRSGSATSALDAALRSLVDNGNLQELQKDKALEAYGYSGKANRVMRLPN